MHTDLEKDYLLKAINAVHKHFIVISPEFKILAKSEHTAEMYDKITVGDFCYKVFYERTKPCGDCPAVSVLNTQRPVLKDKHRFDESSKWKACRYFSPIFSGKTVEAVAVFFFDHPSREETEEKFKRSNSFLRNLLLSSVDGVIAADKTGKILMFNDAAVEVTGYRIDHALDRLDIREIYPGDGARDVMRKLRSEDYGGKGKLQSYHVNVLNKNGDQIPISLNAAIVYEGEKEVATIGFFHDLREELRMQNELKKTQIQLVQAEKMSSLGKLAAGVAHQLNNPLGGITLYSKLALEEYNLEEAPREDLNRILKDAQRCSDIVKELLEFARQTSHMVRPQNINKAISRTIFLLENQALFQNIEIRKDFSEDLPDVPVDIQQMNHVFMNVILNAAQAMDGNGKLSIETSLISDKNQVSIRISDTGPGIPEETLQHIFEPFFTTKDEGKGTGLGLSMAYGIVENHGGMITAKSQLGTGTTFIIELPISMEDQEGDTRGK